MIISLLFFSKCEAGFALQLGNPPQQEFQMSLNTANLHHQCVFPAF